MNKAVQNQLVYTVTPHTPLCQLQEVEILRDVDVSVDEDKNTARMSLQTKDEVR